jgi:hypothetical protein
VFCVFFLNHGIRMCTYRHKQWHMQEVYAKKVSSCSNNSKDNSADKKLNAKNVLFLKRNARKIVAAAFLSLGPMKVPHSETVLPHLVVCLSLHKRILWLLYPTCLLRETDSSIYHVFCFVCIIVSAVCSWLGLKVRRLKSVITG